MNENNLSWLENFYSNNCNDYWEHFYGITIRTLDNPGWDVTVDLSETIYSELNIDRIEIDNGDDDWMHCWIEEGVFHGCGDCLKLNKILEILRELTH